MKTLEETIKKSARKQKTLQQRLGRRRYVKTVADYAMGLSSSKVEICITDANALAQLYKVLSREIEMDYIKEEFLLFVVHITIVRGDNEFLLCIPKDETAYKYYVLRHVVECFYKDIWG